MCLHPFLSLQVPPRLDTLAFGVFPGEDSMLDSCTQVTWVRPHSKKAHTAVTSGIFLQYPVHTTLQWLSCCLSAPCKHHLAFRSSPWKSFPPLHLNTKFQACVVQPSPNNCLFTLFLASLVLTPAWFSFTAQMLLWVEAFPLPSHNFPLLNTHGFLSTLDLLHPHFLFVTYTYTSLSVLNHTIVGGGFESKTLHWFRLAHGKHHTPCLAQGDVAPE